MNRLLALCLVVSFAMVAVAFKGPKGKGGKGKPGEAELKAHFEMVDTDSSGGISLAEAGAAIEAAIAAGASEEMFEDLDETSFSAADANGDGELQPEELKAAAMAHMQPH